MKKPYHFLNYGCTWHGFLLLGMCLAILLYFIPYVYLSAESVASKIVLEIILVVTLVLLLIYVVDRLREGIFKAKNQDNDFIYYREKIDRSNRD